MISVSQLSKYYGEYLAVNDVSFEIDEGHVYGFLGPNGAGKFTTMNIITGCLPVPVPAVSTDMIFLKRRIKPSDSSAIYQNIRRCT